MARREDPIILSVSALLRFGLMARASLGGKVSSLSSISGWSAGTIMVPEDLRGLRRGRVGRVIGFVFSSPSELDVEVSLETVLGGTEEGSVTDGTGVSVVVETSEEGVSEDDMARELIDEWW